MMMGSKHLIKCWLWKGLWVLSVVAFVLAWVAVIRRTAILNMDPLFLFWNALILGVLATPIKLDCHTCNTCNPRGGMPM